MIILRARWDSASARQPAARTPGVVAGNRRKCQFTPRTSRLLLLPTLIADKGDHLCSVGSNPGLSVARQQPRPLVTAPSSVDVCYRFGRLTRGKATVEIMMQLVIICRTNSDLLIIVKSCIETTVF